MLYEIIGGSRCGDTIDMIERPIGAKHHIIMDITPKDKIVKKVTNGIIDERPLPDHVYSIEDYLVCANNQLILIPNKS